MGEGSVKIQATKQGAAKGGNTFGFHEAFVWGGEVQGAGYGLTGSAGGPILSKRGRSFHKMGKPNSKLC